MRKNVVIALAGLLAWAGSAAAELKLGYVDSEVLKERLPAFREAQRQLDQLKADLERQAQDQQSRLQKMQEDFRKQELLMSEARKAELQAEFEDKVRQLKEFTEQKFGPEGELMKKNVELSSPIFEKINAAIQALAKEEGYDFIFDASSPATGLVYAQDKYDLTEHLLQRLQEGSEPAKTPSR